ncbi:YhgE/Pip domain-containing protein [Methanosphaera sp. ISO3-F5]|uniref:YhgE/Pip domain-containing protein n=1 Tax=Methanosphaera sp. ISO3-F5 TaxID=1452353 RepID=UPI002B25AF0D|nr:YhgE/Pip domain-containing protein [Methanosphaera sp. ISO3-F5]WQH64560.1 YhgE/Pip domain-containing protein [Methanosphaera sp. ISO3-F5]
MKKLDLRKQEDDTPRRTLNRVDLQNRRKESERKISDIIKKDIRGFTTNPIVMLVLFAVIILPSLYGLVNIYACWDPYENTHNVEFAIANEDLGSQYNGERVEVGAKVVDSLKDNTKFKWVFVTSDELRRGVHNGTYYAGMIIPKNFSESVVSITTNKPHSAELEYIVNLKTNPVGAKLTDAASKEVYNKLNAEIVSFIDVAALEKLGQLHDGLESGADKMEDGANQLSAGADKVADGANQLTAGANKVASGSDQLASGAKAVSTGANTISVNSVKLANGADQLASGASQVSDGTQQVADKSNEIYKIYQKIKEALIGSVDVSKLADDVDKLDSDTSRIAAELNELDKDTYNLSSNALVVYGGAYNLSDNAAELAVEADNISLRTHNVANRFNDLSNQISQLNEAVKNGESTATIKEILERIDKGMNDTNTKLNDLNTGAHLVSDGSSSVATGANQLADGTRQLAQGSDQLASGASELSSGVHVLSNGTVELASGAELLGYSSASALRNASNEIGFAAEQLSAVSEINQDDASDYFFSPVVLKRHEEFPTNNYGSQVAPFYIVLSMWVGALVTNVMLKTGTSVGTEYKPHEMYIGKLMLFNIMAILQTTVTLIGAGIFGIDISNLLVFVFSCYFVSVVFMTIVYSLTSVFGDVGKGISILLLVFQISGTGGIYPIEIMSELFGWIYSYLPMTHAITIVRESELGLIWANYLPSFAFLLILGIVVILLSILLKQRWDKRTKFFEEKLEESDLFN